MLLRKPHPSIAGRSGIPECDLGPGVEEVAGWLTPNPGGVGPMTRAMLIKNTYEAEARRRP